MVMVVAKLLKFTFGSTARVSVNAQCVAAPIYCRNACRHIENVFMCRSVHRDNNLRKKRQVDDGKDRMRKVRNK